MTLTALSPDAARDSRQMLAEAGDQLEQRLAQAMYALRHPARTADGAASSEALVTRLERAEGAAVEALATDAARQAHSAVATVRITADLRRIDQLVSQLELQSGQPSGLPETLQEPLRRMAALTTAQLDGSSECLRTCRANHTQRVLAEESDLDSLYDLLLAEVIDAVADGAVKRDAVVPILAIVRKLERIGDHACHIVENAIALSLDVSGV